MIKPFIAQDLREVSPLVLAYIGDSIYELYARCKSATLGAGSYVREGTEGKIVAVVYMIQIVIVGLITLRVWRKVGKTIDFDALRESW